MFMRFEDFKQEFPKIAKQLITTRKDVFDGNFVYHIRQNKIYVIRQEFIGGNTSDNFEGNAKENWSGKRLNRMLKVHFDRRSKKQRRLLEGIEK